MIIICAYLADYLLNIGEIMKISNLILAALLCTPVIASAKPAQFDKPYKSKDTVENIQPKRYIVKDVNVTLSSKMNAPDFLNQDQIKQLAAESETPEALLFNLSRLIPGATQSQFTAHLDQALYAADVLGYATAAKGK